MVKAMDSMDNLDWKILYLLCRNSRIPFNHIARLNRTSRNKVVYRIKRLERSVIRSYGPVLDYPALGYPQFLILFNPLLDAGFLRNHKNLLHLHETSGAWRYAGMFCFKDTSVYDSFIRDFRDRVGSFLVHPIQVLKDERQVPRLAGDPQFGRVGADAVELSTADRKVLAAIGKDPLASLAALGKEIGLTYETVSDRLKRLRESGALLGFSADVSMRELGYAREWAFSEIPPKADLKNVLADPHVWFAGLSMITNHLILGILVHEGKVLVGMERSTCTIMRRETYNPILPAIMEG